MTSLRNATAIAATLAMSLPALAQTETTAPTEMPTAEQGNSQSHDMGGQDKGAMHQMMREMMMEMMQGKPSMDAERGERAERYHGKSRHHGARMDRNMRHGGGMREPRDGMRAGMMHGAGMKIVFAIADADGDGALSLAENKDGKVEMIEIEAFFHGSSEDPSE
jgi:hypothetical protein